MRFSRVSHREGTSICQKAGSGRGRALLRGCALLTVASLLGGCDVKSFFDPSELGRFDRHPLEMPILSSISSIEPGVDDPTNQFYNAGEVQPTDLEVIRRDYVIGRNDLVNISVTDLVGPGVETTKTTRVSESGNVSLPLIGQIKAIGLTEAQLEQAIVNGYRNANLIQNAQVSATVVEARARTFSILGSVNAPGQYAIPQSDFRVLDALVMSRDVGQSTHDLYIIRRVSEDPKPGESENAPSAPGSPSSPGGNPSDSLAPQSRANPLATNVALMDNAAPGGANDLAPAPVPPAGAAGAVGASAPAPAPVPAPAGNKAPAPAPAPSAQTSPQPFHFNAPLPPEKTRTIHVPLDALRNGDLRYNIVIRPHDLIIVPEPTVGFYYMSGHVARVGVYNLTGQQITMKEAVVSAGMLDGVAIPQRTDLIRRIGPNREVFARINLAKIWEGEQPDIFLKPYDIVHVGTNFIAPFIAAIRGGFRITYGFGFLYDRNYAPQQTVG